jgi:hypothetical protein
MSDIDTAFAATIASLDPKTAVNQFCQRYCRRPLSKEDIAYTVQKFEGGYQCTVKLNCIEGQEFAGELHQTQKEAEKSASVQILTFYQTQIAQMPKAEKKKKKPASATDGGASKMLKPDGTPMDPQEIARSSKSELNSTCSKILRRLMEKGDVQYETAECVGGYQATVQMPGLPGEWGQQIWAGEVTSKKQDAEQSAAAIALAAIRADPSLMAQHNAPPKPKNWTPGAGKGKGKGKQPALGKGKQGSLQVVPDAASQWNAAAAMYGLAAMGLTGLTGVGTMYG